MNIEQLELLPKFCNHRQYHKHWDYERTFPRYHGENIFVILDHILQNNIEKSWDLTFHYICKKIPKNLRRYIYSYLPEDENKYWSGYYVENGILYHKEWKSPWKSIPSIITKYKIKYYYTPYKSKPIEVKKINENPNLPFSYFQFSYRDKKNNKILLSKANVTEVKVPLKAVFKGSKEYQRLKHEEIKQQRRKNKETKRKNKEQAYSFLTKGEIELRKQKEIDKWKIIKHGFDENSFRTNPSLQ